MRGRLGRFVRQNRRIWRNEQEIQNPNVSREHFHDRRWEVNARKTELRLGSRKHVAAFLMKGNTPVFSLG
jgi:hypothetical protein